MFSRRVRLIIIIGSTIYGLYQLAIEDSDGWYLLVAAGVLAVGQFRTKPTE